MLNVPFASTVPSAASATAYGEPGTSASAHASASTISSNVRSGHARGCRHGLHGRCQRAAQAAPLRGEHREPQAAVLGGEEVAEGGPAADLRTLVGHLERALRRDGEPQHADLAEEGEQADREARAAQQRDAEPDRQPAVGPPSDRGSAGSTENAAASATARASAAGPTRPRAPRHAHGAPARPLTIATASTAANPRHSPAAAHAAASSPAATATPSTASTTTSAAHAIRGRGTPSPASAARVPAGSIALRAADTSSTSPRSRQATTDTMRIRR